MFKPKSEKSAINALMTNGTMVDYPGRMSALFFTRGCNFRCGFCHNSTLLDSGGKTYSWEDLGEICDRFQKQWVHAVTISGGEPTIQPALKDTILFFKDRGFLVKLDSNGARPEILSEVLPLIDYIAMDIKGSLKNYSRFAGYHGDLHKIEESIKLIMEQAKDYEFRTTLIESWHTPEEIERCAQLVRGAKLYIFQAFLPREDLPDPSLRTEKRTRPDYLQKAADIASKYVKKAVVRGE